MMSFSIVHLVLSTFGLPFSPLKAVCQIVFKGIFMIKSILSLSLTDDLKLGRLMTLEHGPRLPRTGSFANSSLKGGCS
jgi:hypothetical protein